MGLRHSKSKRSSYDVAAVVSNKDFTYKKHERPLPKVELPVKKEIIEQSNEQEDSAANTLRETETITIAEQVKEVGATLLPDWVNENNFKTILLKTYPNIKEVTVFKACPALAAGENYATLMLRVKITIKLEDDASKDFSFMLKVPHETKKMQEMLQAMNFFTIENAMYEEVIPELEQMYRDAGAEVKLAAKSYRLELEQKDIHYVLLEDLSVEAFKNANRLECLNTEHTLSVLRKMAQFHAATACRVAKKGGYPAIFSPDLNNEVARAFLKQIFTSFKVPFLENLKTYENGEKYYDLMDNFFENLAELFVHSRQLLPNYFYALNHGDAWCNNILFKYATDGQLKDTIFVDFQNCRWGSPAIDLYYFIFSSVQIDIKLSQFDYFVRYYYEQLRENLKILEYPLEVPSLREFHVQMLNFGIMATITSLITLGIVLLDPTDSAKFENFLGGTEESYKFKNSMYTNARYRKYINEVLPWLYNRGFMEINLRDIDNIASADKTNELENQPATKKNAEIIEHSSSFYPEWLNESLLFNVAQEDCEGVQKVLEFTVSPVTIHLATLLQIDVDIELTDHTNRTLSYLLKIPPNGDPMKIVIPRLCVFEKESMTYRNIIPQLQNLYKEKLGTELVFAPKSFKLSPEKEINNALILENVQSKNFTNAHHSKGLDMKHTEAVLKKLAQFHAASACLFETAENVPEIYKNAERTEDNTDLLVSYIETYLGHVEHFSKLKYYANNFKEFLAKATCSRENKFNVLNHGDCWTKNIMFQHDVSEENISNTYFVDFQLAQYGTPCCDLFQLLLSSPKLNLKLEHFDHFICYYHENLTSNLELLGYKRPIPSLDDLHQELLENAVWATYTVLHNLPIALMEPKDKLNLEKIVSHEKDDVAFKKQLVLSKYYSSHIETILPWLERKGFLNVQ